MIEITSTETISYERFSFLEPKQFYRKVEAIFEALESLGTSEWFARCFISTFYENLAAWLGVTSVHLYDCRTSDFVLLSHWGPPCFEIVEGLRKRLSAIREEEFPWTDRVDERITAVIPAVEDRTMFMVFIADKSLSESNSFCAYFLSAISSLHYALVQNLRRLELLDGLEQARAIQLSLLPSREPKFGDFDIAALSVPAKLVGGDLYDFQLLDSDTLAVTIADAAGHGLAAALQARDVITGLRMGVEREMKTSRIVEKLNRVIHRTGLGSRFVSIVFGELLSSGSFAYVNAGHPRPFLFNPSGFQQLEVGGMILGPRPDSSYRVGFVQIERGGALLLFSDGVIEHTSPDGKEFGLDQLKIWTEESCDVPAASAVQDLFRRLQDFGDGQPFRDDATVVLVRRPHQVLSGTEVYQKPTCG